MLTLIFVLLVFCNILMAFNIILRIKINNPKASKLSFISLYNLRSFSLLYLFPAFNKKDYSAEQRRHVKMVNIILISFYIAFIVFAIIVYISFENDNQQLLSKPQ